MSTPQFTPGQLRIWWIPQVPMKAFRADVADFEQGHLLLQTLANYDLFQFENNIKPDYCNAGGLEVFENGEWTDWYDTESGDDYDQFIANREAA